MGCQALDVFHQRAGVIDLGPRIRQIAKAAERDVWLFLVSVDPIRKAKYIRQTGIAGMAVAKLQGVIGILVVVRRMIAG